MSTRPAILLVAPDFPPIVQGGGAFVVERLAEQYSAHGFDVHVIALDVTRGGWNLPPAEYDRGQYRVTFLPLAMNWSHQGIVYGNAFPPSIPSLLWLQALLRGRRWHGVHLHGLPILMVDLVAALARLRGIPYILTVHGLVQDPRRYGPVLGQAYRAWLRLERLLYGHAAAITAVSRATLDEVRSEGFGGATLAVVPNAPHPPPSEPSNQSSSLALDRWGLRRGDYALCLGNLISRKGHLTAIDAVAGLQKENCLPAAFRFAIVGRDPGAGHREELEQRLHEKGLEGAVRILGEVTDEEREILFSTCRFVLCTTLYEASPMVIVEAQQRRCPIVASDIPPIRELVEDGRAALLFQPGNAESLREKLRDLFCRPGLLETLRAEARSRTQVGPDWPEITERYLALLRPSDELADVQDRTELRTPSGNDGS